MQRLCLALLLGACATQAAADWTRVGGIPDIYSVYADTSRLTRTGRHVSMWTLYDFLMPDTAVSGEAHQSTEALREYDCENARVRLLSFVDFSGHMGRGKVITSTSDPAGTRPGRWEPVVSGAVDQALWKTACER